MLIYDFQTYKEAIKGIILDRRARFGSKFTFEKMAIACGVQKTYYSKVMNSHAHLNPDQLFSSGEYLKLLPKEIEFLLLLRELEIASNSNRIDLLKLKIEKIRNENLKIKSQLKLNTTATIEEHQWEYFTNIDLQLVHLFLTIPNFSKRPELICDKIGVNNEKLMHLVNKLKEFNFIELKNGVYNATDPNLHLPEDSPVFHIFGILNRVKTIEKIRKTKSDSTDDYFFSVIFSAESKLHQQLKKKILILIKEVHAEVIKQDSEQVYQLNIDFLKWS